MILQNIVTMVKEISFSFIVIMYVTRVLFSLKKVFSG
jgi:hypothetical protein